VIHPIVSVPSDARAIAEALAGVVRADQRGGELAELGTDVGFQADAVFDQWRAPSETKARGVGDCANLLRAGVGQAGPGARVGVVRVPGGGWHAFLVRADGSVLDLAAERGMGLPGPDVYEGAAVAPVTDGLDTVTSALTLFDRVRDELVRAAGGATSSAALAPFFWELLQLVVRATGGRREALLEEATKALDGQPPGGARARTAAAVIAAIDPTLARAVQRRLATRPAVDKDLGARAVMLATQGYLLANGLPVDSLLPATARPMPPVIPIRKVDLGAIEVDGSWMDDLAGKRVDFGCPGQFGQCGVR
jgi:hypothetical protein